MFAHESTRNITVVNFASRFLPHFAAEFACGPGDCETARPKGWPLVFCRKWSRGLLLRAGESAAATRQRTSAGGHFLPRREEYGAAEGLAQHHNHPSAVPAKRTCVRSCYESIESGVYATRSATSNLVSKTVMNAESHAGCAGHAGAVTRFPSTQAFSMGTSTYVPPAVVTSGATAG